MKFCLSYSAVLFWLAACDGFSAPATTTRSIFAPPTSFAEQRTTPTKTEGVEIELPNFDVLFDQIQQVSPLAQAAFQLRDGGFASVSPDSLDWTSLSQNDNEEGVFQIDKIDDFRGLGCPMIRFRAKMEGPLVYEPFAYFIQDLETRRKWDPSIAVVEEPYPVKDLDSVNLAMGVGKYGDCSRLGVGYVRTKKYLAVPGREHLTLCGMQDLANGGKIMWGTEMEDRHNHLLPEDLKRTVRAKSHLFSTTCVPTGPNTFDVEYCLQMYANFPNWISSPVLVEVVKNMFRYAKTFYGGDDIVKFMERSAQVDQMQDRNSILMTP
mmetsp:Transcript_42912/g.63662  ORF Transcript_42912/g.63662 Transcript_42912/m.63662 type:complete len:322 (-) Transcript_42912:259-1224(-)